MYIKITQDGVGRLSKKDSPKEIEGLYTDSLQICIAVILVGHEKISLIHDTGRIRLEGENSLRSEIDYTEAHTVYIAHSAVFAKGTEHYNKITEHATRIWNAIKEYNKTAPKEKNIKQSLFPLRNSKVAQLESEYVCSVAISREGVIRDVVLQNEQLNIDGQPLDSLFRFKLNETNNFFSVGEFIPSDLQYDTDHFCDPKSLFKNTSEVTRIINENRENYCANPVILQRVLWTYYMLKENVFRHFHSLPENAKNVFLYQTLYGERESDPILLLIQATTRYRHGDDGVVFLSKILDYMFPASHISSTSSVSAPSTGTAYTPNSLSTWAGRGQTDAATTSQSTINNNNITNKKDLKYS